MKNWFVVIASNHQIDTIITNPRQREDLFNKVDALLDQGRFSTDLEARKKTYTEFQEYVTSKFYVLPLYQTQDNLATTKKVHGVTIDGASGQPFGAYTIWLDQ